MHKIAVIAIGNEILDGFTINSNATFISRALFKQGYRVAQHLVLPDHLSSLRQGLQVALETHDLVICTGGLGPTCDDITREIAAELFLSDFRYDEELAADLKKRYCDGNLIALENQATVPSKAVIIKNLLGSAPGLIFKNEKATLILLPGVPVEMRGMLLDVLTYVKHVFPLTRKSFYKELHFFGLSEAIVDPFLRQLEAKYPLVEFGIYPSQGTLSVHLTTQADEESQAFFQLDPVYEELARQFRTKLFESERGKIEEAVHNKFIKEGWTLSAAESCTGGAFAARLTSLSGSSGYFLGSLVTYSNPLKTRLLGVSETLLQEKGAVSEEVVLAMWEGVLERTGSDYAIAVSGIAGPAGGSVEKPVGTVWCASGRRANKPHIWKLELRGTREMIIERSVNALLSSLL